MKEAYVIDGVVRDNWSVTLNEPLPMASGSVRVVVEPLAEQTPVARSHEDILRSIRAQLKAAGHTPPTKEDVDLRIKAERDSWS